MWWDRNMIKSTKAQIIHKPKTTPIIAEKVSFLIPVITCIIAMMNITINTTHKAFIVIIVKGFNC